RVANEIERARISMMARSSNAPSIGRIQKRKTNFSKSSLSACNARPVHTDGPQPDLRCAVLADKACAKLRDLLRLAPDARAHCQSGEHDFSVMPSGNFVPALPHALSNCAWVKFSAPLRLAPLRLASLRSASLSL